MKHHPPMTTRETLVSTVTRIRRGGLFEVTSEDGRQFTLHRLLLYGSGLNYRTSLHVGDQVRFVVKTIVRHELEKVTGVIPSGSYPDASNTSDANVR
jgi:hypothetical protein